LFNDFQTRIEQYGVQISHITTSLLLYNIIAFWAFLVSA